MDKAKFRFYLFDSDGIWKLPAKKLGWALPQYAGDKQKTLTVLYWQEGGAIKTVFRPGLLAFDAEGRWDRAHFVDGVMAMIDANRPVEAHCWQPTQADLDRVMLDLLGSGDARYRSIPYVKP